MAGKERSFTIPEKLSRGADGVPLRGNTDGRDVKSMSIGTEKDNYGGNIGMSVVLLEIHWT